MVQIVFVSIFLTFWIVVYFTDVLLKTSSYASKYLGFLNKHGISISIVQIRWFTTHFNRHFIKIGSKKSTALKIWFNFGVIFSLVLLVMSVFLLMMIIINTFANYSVEQQVLTPVMPGVNLPMNQVWYYLLTLLICGVVHEVGHALAAAGEEVRVNGFGIFLLAIYPGAYVDVCPHQVGSISPLQQLRIYCAGVWHNIIIVLVALVFLLCFPTFVMLLYYSGHGVVVTHVQQNSPVSGTNGVEVGDIMTYIDDCHVTDTNQWARCISKVTMSPTSGYCIHRDVVDGAVVSGGGDLFNQTNFKQLLDCCVDASNSHLCFYHQATDHKFTLHHKNYACLSARIVTEGKKCHEDADCFTISNHHNNNNDHIKNDNDNGFDLKSNHVNKSVVSNHVRSANNNTNNVINSIPTNNNVCIHPSVDNSTWLVKVTYTNKLKSINGITKQPLLFLGHPYDLYYSISLSNYEPKWSFLPLHLPYIIETLCKYLVSLSGALAIMNIIPCYALDGQWIIQALYNIILPFFIRSTFTRDVVYTATIMFGTILIIVNVIIAFWTLFVR